MHITARNADFARELGFLSGIVARKATISVLANVRIQAANGALLLSATDLEIGMVCACPAEVAIPGDITLKADKLIELIKAQDANDCTLTDAKGVVNFSSGGFKSRLQSLPSKDFPAIPTPPEDAETTVLPREAFRTALAQVRPAVHERGTTYFLQGAQLELPEGNFILAATETARLAACTSKREGKEWESILIPTKTLDELKGLLSEGSDDITLSRSDRHLFFDTDGRLLVSRMVDGKFPAWRRILPTSNDQRATVNRAAFSKMLKRHLLISPIVKVTMTSGAVEVSTVSMEVGDGVERIPTDYTGEDVSLKVNGDYLIDFLDTATSPNVVLALKDSSTPAMLIDGGFVGVVMGMRS